MCSASLKKTSDKNHILASSEVHFHSPSSDILYYIQWLKWVLQRQDVCICTQAWIKLVHDRIHCWIVTNMVMNF